MITQTELKELLYYNPYTGNFLWTNPLSNRVKKGSIAGTTVDRNGKDYRNISVKGKIIYAHRLAWLYMTGSFPENEIDHEDGNGLNNKFDNLRDVTHGVNNKNVKRPKDNKSGRIGVNWSKSLNKWRAEIMVNSKRFHLGYFKEFTDAVMARKNAELKHNFHANHGRI